ncbi:MAG: TIGR02452 family protein [Sandaracinus sp.]|nr:TIGR02452 family protein [Sandaracinus sp.]MCB9617502.1 TIGR02452 family protein [Sandaracinus sp.]MCB9620292.1 TIGR02452 family protein [Sandaracinus sp.]
MEVNPKAAEILRIAHEGRYETADGSVDVSAALAASVEGSRTWSPDALERVLAARARSATSLDLPIEVTGETTQEAAFRLAHESAPNLALLNFASAKNPGGGFLGGAKAQEEDLCRCSLLYLAIEPQRLYYETNRARRGTDAALYTDHLIHSPQVPFLRVRSKGPWVAPVFADVITAPAPNARALDLTQHGAALERAFRHRARLVIALAAEQGHRSLILGAWGCGAFRNDPVLAADAFSDALATVDHGFTRVVFAVFDPRSDAPNTRAFERRFARA